MRGAIQVDRDDPAEILGATRELLTEVVRGNEITPADLISIVFTLTPDLKSCFPAVAARDLGFVDVPLLCATEVDVAGALPHVVRLLAHVESDRPRSAVRHIYLRGAARLRPDLAA
ncbi:chorismate mutase [Actinophytocola oryzae]|uniref:chorismate mutase n=1 Tax=Actinophytocola oryzae TaxID=502181 RepID=UPI001FB99970|nr:chorismate mutase [Actinophytocola oryzae]